MLRRTETDYLIFLRNLANVPLDPDARSMPTRCAPLLDAYYAPGELTADVRDATVAWLRAWSRRVREGGLDDTTESPR